MLLLFFSCKGNKFSQSRTLSVEFIPTSPSTRRVNSSPGVEKTSYYSKETGLAV